MSYVIYNKETTKIWEVCRSGRMYGTRSYKTEGQAKAALTREVNKHGSNLIAIAPTHLAINLALVHRNCQREMIRYDDVILELEFDPGTGSIPNGAVSGK